jgi:chemotaxis protein methyltransferase CheR
MLSDADFVQIARQAHAISGAALRPDMNAVAHLRLQPLARREGFGSVAELIAAANIRPDGSLWDLIAEALAQNDTRFFRDRATFARIRASLLPEAMARRGHERVRIWSAGCSTGQEAYSIAMIAEEIRAAGINLALEIVATDFSPRLIEKARGGLYTQFEVQRGLPIRALIRHFERSGDMWRVSDRLRAAVQFETQNLLRQLETGPPFDIVILSHVLTAFDQETRQSVLARVAAAMRPDGVLILGEGETLPEGAHGLVWNEGLARLTGKGRVAA